jgi:hypothetical protein
MLAVATLRRAVLYHRAVHTAMRVLGCDEATAAEFARELVREELLPDPPPPASPAAQAA